ncbi:hypothetical protein [Rhodospirillaceae bacterium SYSU D60014]|uniref:hypothetical protein n=1 Tax=Virgifigura deserti TaxID=2268457 RepID=UPI000E65FF03
MTEGRRLPPLQILADSIRFLFGRFPTFLRLAALPILLLGLAFVMPKILASSGQASSTGLLFVAFTSILVISYVLSLISFTTAWHRVVIDGRSRLRLGRSEWRYLGYSLLLLVGLLVAQFIGVSLAGAVPAMAGKVAVALAPLLLVFFLAVRVMLVLPAAAAGQALSLVDAWDLARGNSLRLIGLFAVILVSWWLLALAGQMLATATDISSPWYLAIRGAEMAVGILYWGLTVTAMSLCYRWLVSPR